MFGESSAASTKALFAELSGWSGVRAVARKEPDSLAKDALEMAVCSTPNTSALRLPARKTPPAVPLCFNIIPAAHPSSVMRCARAAGLCGREEWLQEVMVMLSGIQTGTPPSPSRQDGRTGRRGSQACLRPSELYNNHHLRGHLTLWSASQRYLTVPATHLTVPATGLTAPATHLTVPATGLTASATHLTVPATGLTVPATHLIMPATGLTAPAIHLTVAATGVVAVASGRAGRMTNVRLAWGHSGGRSEWCRSA